MKYKILQIKDSKNCNYLFASYERAVKYGFNLEDYKVVYEGDRDFDFVDDLDSKMNILSKALEVTNEGEFTQRLIAMDGRAFYKPLKK